MNSLLVRSFSRPLLYGSRQGLRQWPTSCKVLGVPRLHQFNRLSSTKPASGEPSFFDYQYVFDAELPHHYKKGGPHPVHFGDVLQNRYQVVNKLGITATSLIWLAYDLYLKQWVALKIRNADCRTNNTEVLRALATSTPSRGSHVIPRILDEFQITGPNGTHLCSTRAAALGTVSDSLLLHQFPHDVARAVAYELTIAIAHMHAQGYVHGEICLGNVLVKPRPTFNSYSISEFVREWGEPRSEPVELIDGRPLPVGVPSVVIEPLGMGGQAEDYTLEDANIVLCGFGSAYSPAKEQRLGRDCSTELDLRPPDAIFKPDVPLSFSADIWSLALAIWDILGIQKLFSFDAGLDEDYVLSRMVYTLGPFPPDWPEKWIHKRRYFDDQGQPLRRRKIHPFSLEEAFEQTVQHFLREAEKEEHPREEVVSFLDLMRRMLKFGPEERPTIEEVLNSEWMVRWAGPAYERKQAVNASSVPPVPLPTQ